MILYCWIKETIGEHFRRWQESSLYKQRKYKCNPTARGLFFAESFAKPCRCLFDFHYSSESLELAVNHIVFFVLRSQNMDSVVNYMGFEILQSSTGNGTLPDANCILVPPFTVWHLFRLSRTTCTFFISNVKSVSNRPNILVTQRISEPERRPS